MRLVYINSITLKNERKTGEESRTTEEESFAKFEKGFSS